MLKMINQVKEIEYIKRKNEWYLWYINNTGSLDNLVFQSESDAKFFRKGFKFIAKSLHSDQEKWVFYEKTTLTVELIKRFITLGSSFEFITETLNLLHLTPEISIKSL